ncbi:replication-associated recombination protein A [Paenibacillus alginolyticus]|uniref:Replication-associated recombination protein A n=1 Tax=Paenibacillus alginolyticus TaxID=59839 RepID=A0ABT4GEE8_9BACL|nr:replication-associated recombination protein A [Paenibacillus alginolyticus]MCY9694549.1 replication-associated recombination protein A [Paenibacillus alginolyticus]MEC0142710.1 replication-associated recombination protein A [Paenibacillus alginolyticus]
MNRLDLFDYNQPNTHKPLAERMRPRALDEFFGQKHLVGEGRVLRRLIEQDKVTSMILQGPPSSGKTTLATIISNMTKSHFEKLNGVSMTIAELREVVHRAKENLSLFQQRTILFLDEIHALKSNVQEALLPIVEDGTITLIGATTESVAHDIIPPLVSRCRIYRLEALKKEDLEAIIRSALSDSERGLGGKYKITPEASEYLGDVSNGDVRNALIALETAAYSIYNTNTIDLKTIQEAYESRINAITTTDFYDLTSAFIKSMRGSQTDAAIYWLARLLDSGVDPMYIARRVVVHSAEDVGMANPHALQMAIAAKQAVEFLGLPEGRIPLAEAVIYICESPKSNSAYKAIGRALDAVKSLRNFPVPENIRDSSKSYINPIDKPNSRMQYLPPEMEGFKFYEPQNSGTESKIYVKHQERNHK